MTRYDAMVIGAGPAGLMAADVLSKAGHSVGVFDAMPSVARKFLMAGKSGLNLTKDEPLDAFLAAFDAAPTMGPILRDFDNVAVQDWAKDLRQEIFTGSSGRVFPNAMKASPLLRAWLARLNQQSVRTHARHRLVALKGHQATFETPDGPVSVLADVVVLALGGASWSRLGSDGAWVEMLHAIDVATTDFAPSNMGFDVAWSAHMEPFFGTPVKPAAVSVNGQRVTGEFVVSKSGVEGSAIYAISAKLRDQPAFELDLLPDQSPKAVRQMLATPRGKLSMSNFLRKRLNLSKVKIALLNEFARPFPADIRDLPVKSLTIPVTGPRPIDEAISTAGGVRFDALTSDLQIKGQPIFCAGEMLDWDAPTGGYLITGCLATGRWAGLAAARLLA